MQVCFRFLDKKYLTCGFFLSNTTLKVVLEHTDIEDVIQAKTISAWIEVGEAVAREQDFQSARNVSK